MNRSIVAAVLFATACVAQAQSGAAAPAQAQPAFAVASTVFATVDDVVIRTDEYDAAWSAAQRQKFYHRSAPEAEVAKLRREVGDQLIDRVLLAAEVRRRGIAPDRDKVRDQLAQYEQRYRSSPQWAAIQAERMPALVRELERQSALERLQADVRHVAPPSESTVREFHAKRAELFTEPEQIRFSLILLKVDPSSPKAAWDKAREEAAAIRERLAKGQDFASLARLHSVDASAERGGDMGYVHRGMLPEGLADEILRQPRGGVTAPLQLLEGVALARFDDRKAPQLRAFEQVRERATQLWMREAAERRWQAFLAGLRSGATVKVVDASRYPPPAGDRR